MALGAEIFKCGGHVGGVPGDDGVGDQGEAARLVRLMLMLPTAHPALATEEEEAPQGVEALPPVELPADAPAVVLTLEVAQDEERLHQPPVLLERPGQCVLARRCLERTSVRLGALGRATLA